MRTATAALLALLALPAAGSAQATPFVHAGPALPLGDIARRWNLGYEVGGGIGFGSGTGRALRLEVAYARFGVDAEGLFEELTGEEADEAEASGAALGALTASAALVHRFSSRAGGTTPYLVGSVGYLLLTYGSGELLVDGERILVEENRDSGVAGTLGAGIDVAVMPGLSVFAEGRLAAAFTFDGAPDLFVPLRLGLAFPR